MLRCINCYLSVDRMLRHVVSTLQSTMQTLLASWISMQQLPPEAVICQECFLRLNQHCTNGNINADRELGHTHVCLGCGQSVLEGRRHVRYHTIEASDPIIETILSRDIMHFELTSRDAHVCHLCWMRASRQLAHGVIRGHPDAVEHAEVEHQPIDAEQLIVPQQAIPVAPPLPQLPINQQVPAVSADRIILPHYKRAANTSSHCVFQGCFNQSGHLIPLFIKIMLLKQHHIYVPHHSRVCEIHLYSNEWSFLVNNTNLSNSFTAQQIEDLLRIIERNADSFDFENVHEMPNHICYYWTGLNVLDFLALFNEIPVLRNVNKGKTCLAIYLTKHYKRAANTSSHCVFQGCFNQSGHLIPLFIKIMLLKQHHIYVPHHSRVCEIHLYSNEWSFLVNNTNLSNSFTAQQIEDLLRIIERNADSFDFENVHEMPNHICYYWTGLNVLDFLALFNEIPVLRNVNKGKTCLAIYLTKLRTGDSDSRLSTLYNMPRSTLESHLNKMRNYFKNHFVPNHVGLQHITREEVAQRNLLIPNNLFGSPNAPITDMPVIVICDGTYIFIQKSSNYFYQKQTYSLHKYINLVKPFLIVACDGHIIDVAGPYAATQTDAEIMIHLFENENGPMRSFFRPNDIFILDRGFRDSIPMLESHGYKVFKPESVDEGETQLSTLQANKSRCVTLCRWVVEVVNGRFKRDFKLFRQDFFNRASLHLMDDFLIAAALINRFHPLIQDRPDASQIISRALYYLNEPNHLARFVNEFHLNRRRTMFTRIDGNLPQLEQFPTFTTNQLILVALGPYQVKQARSYYGEHIRENGLYVIEVCPEVEHSEEMVSHVGGNYPFLIRGRIKSRHIGQRHYFSYLLVDREPSSNNAIDALLGYCCSCVVGNRTVGCCCHVMTLIWYLGWARHRNNIDAPAAFLNDVLITIED